MKSIIFNYLAPILSTMLIGHMCNFPEKILPMIPSIIGVFNTHNDSNKKSRKDYIPSAPEEPKMKELNIMTEINFHTKTIYQTSRKNQKKFGSSVNWNIP